MEGFTINQVMDSVDATVQEMMITVLGHTDFTDEQVQQVFMEVGQRLMVGALAAASASEDVGRMRLHAFTLQDLENLPETG